MTPYPLLFDPLLKPKVWGGRALERLGKALPPWENIGESWELADLPPSIPAGRSVIANGELAGRTLHDTLQEPPLRRLVMGSASLWRFSESEEAFPLLIKYLHARENLSVQVHPSPQYAQQHPEAHVKSEAWVVIEAEPGAVVYKGIKPGVTREAFTQHIRTGEVVNDLLAIPVNPGDCHYLPTGTCHALGAGIVVAEVQTPSDTTFRVYDWGRGGPGRELHIEQALECIDFSGRSPPQPRNPEPNTRDGITTTSLTTTEFFEIERVDAAAGASFEIITQNLPQVWMTIAGEGSIAHASAPTVELRPGVTILIPAAAESWEMRFNAATWMLCIRLPSPLRGMIA